MLPARWVGILLYITLISHLQGRHWSLFLEICYEDELAETRNVLERDNQVVSFFILL